MNPTQAPAPDLPTQIESLTSRLAKAEHDLAEAQARIKDLHLIVYKILHELGGKDRPRPAGPTAH